MNGYRTLKSNYRNDFAGKPVEEVANITIDILKAALARLTAQL